VTVACLVVVGLWQDFVLLGNPGSQFPDVQVTLPVEQVSTVFGSTLLPGIKTPPGSVVDSQPKKFVSHVLYAKAAVINRIPVVDRIFFMKCSNIEVNKYGRMDQLLSKRARNIVND